MISLLNLEICDIAVFTIEKGDCIFIQSKSLDVYLVLSMMIHQGLNLVNFWFII